MGKVIFKAISREFKNGCLMLPATPADKRVLDAFCRSAENNYITVTANLTKHTKTYDQCKTVFAIINLRFEIMHGRKPTSTEQALVYSNLLNKYADRVEDPDDPENTIALSLSQMNKIQAAHFISSIMADTYEYANGQMPTYQEIELKQLFEEFNSGCGFGDKNPIDYDKDGNELSVDEWRRKNNFSFASGIQGTASTPLHLHHIISRGARRDLIERPFNWIILTAEEHMLYHEKGWDIFLSIYPSCAPRVKYAFEFAKQPMPFDLQKALIKLGLLDSLQDYED